MLFKQISKKRKIFFIITIILILLTLNVNNIYAFDQQNSNDTEIIKLDTKYIEQTKISKSKEYTIENGNFEDIQKVIDSSNEGDTIKLNGYFQATNNNSMIKIKKKLNITSDTTATLDGNNKSGIFYLNNKSSGTSISNLIFINGYKYSGSAIHLRAQNVTVITCIFENNTGANKDGGAFLTSYDLYESSNLLIDKCIFKGNTAPLSSAGAAVYGNHTKVTNCIFERNYVGNELNETCYEAALQIGMNEEGYIGYVKNCTFIENYLKHDLSNPSFGGAVGLRKGLTIVNSRFIKNSADYGGAINYHESGKIINCTFTQNLGHVNGGAISFFNTNKTKNLTIKNCKFEDNIAPYGGAIFLIGENHNISYCIFKNNIGHNKGGAIYSISANTTVLYSQFTNNTGLTGGALEIIENSILINNIFENNNAILGGAIETFSKLTINHNQFINNKAINGSAIYSYSNLNINDTQFIKNKAKSFLLTAKNTHVKQGDILTISSYYECGDNLLDAIYTLGETILDNNKVDINPACSNQGIILLLNNKTYTSKSNKSGIVIFKIKTKKIPVGNHTYIIYHEDNEYYTDIFNSSDIEIIKKEEKLTKNTHESKNKNKTPKTEKLKYLKTSPQKRCFKPHYKPN